MFNKHLQKKSMLSLKEMLGNFTNCENEQRGDKEGDDVFSKNAVKPRRNSLFALLEDVGKLTKVSSMTRSRGYSSPTVGESRKECLDFGGQYLHSDSSLLDLWRSKSASDCSRERSCTISSISDCCKTRHDSNSSNSNLQRFAPIRNLSAVPKFRSG